jgi:hypothetical protein
MDATTDDPVDLGGSLDRKLGNHQKRYRNERARRQAG